MSHNGRKVVIYLNTYTPQILTFYLGKIEMARWVR